MTRAYQYSTFNLMVESQYDGEKPIIELKPRECGIGTFHALEGELVINQGKFYHCTEGKACLAKDDEKISWGVLHDFQSPHNYKVEIDFDSIEEFLTHNTLFTQNDFISISISGLFKTLKITSTPKQEKPYPTIEQVIAQSQSYYHTMIAGTAIGYFVPMALSTVQKMGLHLHFISEDESIGGHVLDFYTESSDLKIEKIKDILLEI